MKKLFLFLAASLLTLSSYAETFSKVTDVSSLKDGSKILLACEKTDYVSGGFDGTAAKQLVSVSATFFAGKTTLTDPTVITLTKKSTGDWNLYIGTKPIGHEATTDNSVDFKKNEVTDFTIEIGSDGNAVIKSKTGTTKFPQFYSNTSSGKFRLYNSTSQNPVQIYLLDESSVPEKVPTKVELNKESLEMRVGDADVTLTADVTPSDAVDKSVTWGSSNSGIITVANGVVHPVAAGEAYVWVKTTKGENVTDTCWFNILPALDMTKVTYKAVQKADYITAGAKVFFGTIKSDENYVMGLYAGGNNIKGVDATYAADRHSVEAAKAYAYTVEKDGDVYYFKNQDGKYLRTISATKLGDGAKDNYAKWSVGAFDEDDATVLVTNVTSTTSSIYYNFQGTNDLFNVYNNPGTDNCAKVVLYSDLAPDWQERVKEPKMEISGADVTKVGDSWVIDYGEIDKDPDVSAGAPPYYDSKKVTITYGDLSDNIAVTITGANASTYNLPISGDEIKSAGKKTGSQELTIYWEASSVGTYTATLTFHSTTTGISDIVVTLTAKAVDKSSDPQYQPSLALSTKSITVNPNFDNGYDDLVGFTFSAKNLAKTLYVKWEHSSSVLFQYAYQNAAATILAGSDYVALNDPVPFPAGTDYNDVDVLIEVADVMSKGIAEGTYPTKLHFYSYKKDSKTDLAIDETVNISIIVSVDPVSTALDEVDTTAAPQKIFRDGTFYIIRNGVEYNANGTMLK